MVKKKQKPDTEAPTIEKPENPQQQFLKQLGEAINQAVQPVAEAVDNLTKSQQQLNTKIDQNTQRINSVAKSATENPKQEQKLNPMDIMKMITDIINSPIVNKMAEGFFGGKEEPGNTPENVVPPEDYKAYVEFRKGTMENLLETQRAQLKSLQLQNLTKEKELGSDFH